MAVPLLPANHGSNASDPTCLPHHVAPPGQHCPQVRLYVVSCRPPPPHFATMGAMGGMGTTAMRNALLGRGGAGQQHIRAIAGGSRWRPAGGSQAVTDKPGPLLVKPAEGPARVR